MAYVVHLKEFEGPLDLLLYLIEKAEVDIKDIFISEITDQYLAYMKQLSLVDMDAASEFLEMAANLVYMKSRQLLPPKRQESTLADEEEPEALLIRQLQEYKAIKQAAQQLERLQEKTQDLYTRLPEEYVLPPVQIDMDHVSIKDLFQAYFLLFLEQKEEGALPASQEIRQDAFTVRGQIQKLRSLLQARKTVAFIDLFDPYAGKLEKIVTFMALLEMLAHEEVLLEQDRAFSTIYIHKKHLGAEDASFTYMDE